MLPEDIETLTNLYITSCRNKEDVAIGVFVEIIQKLGAGEMLPPNIDTLDKDDLCQIIEELLKYNMSRSQSRYSSYKLPQGYMIYNDMVVNINKYLFDAFYESLDELQLLEAFKLRLCSMLELGNDCGNYSVLTLINEVKRRYKSDTQLKDVAANVLKQFLEIFKRQMK